MALVGLTPQPAIPMARLSTPARVQIAVVVVLTALAFWGTIELVLVKRWLNDGNWSHGFLIPVFSLYFLYARRAELFRADAKPSYLGVAIVALFLVLYFVCAWRLRMAYPQAVMMIGVIFGVTLALGGWGVMRVAWFPILFLFLSVPLPQRIFFSLTLPLREFQSMAAAALMPLFATGLYTEAQAVVIDYVMPGGAQGQLNVEEACSGMRMLMAFVTLGVAMAYLGDRPLWQRIVIVFCCVPIAMFCNTIRVTTTGLLFIFGHEGYATGTPHQLLGMLMLGLAFGLYGLLRFVLSHLFVEDGDEAPVASGGA